MSGFSGGIGNPGMSGPCNCPECKIIRERKAEIKEIEEKVQTQVSIIKDSVKQSIKRLRKECKETVQYLEKKATEKIEQIKNRKVSQ